MSHPHRAPGPAPASTVGHGSFVATLTAAVRPEFAAEVIVPDPGDPVLGTPPCRVPDCARSSTRRGWCQAHYRRWDHVGRPDAGQWAATADPTTWGHQPLASCRAAGCGFAQHRDRMCYAHSRDWRRAESSDIEGWLSRQPPVAHDALECAVTGCRLWAELGEPGLCRSHRSRWRSQGRPDKQEFLFDCATYGEPRFDLRGLSVQARLELQYTLQCRADERRARTTPRSIRPLVRYLAEQQVTSLLDYSPEGLLARASSRIGGTSTLRAFLGYAVDCLSRLRDPDGWDSEYHADTWRLSRLGLPVSRRARFDFTGIGPPWLKGLVKRWLRWRISTGLAVQQVRKDFTALNRMAHLSTGLDDDPASLDRAALEGYLAALAITVDHPKTRSGDISVVATFLRTVHQQQWAPQLPTSTVIYPSDHPRQDTDPPPRALPEQLMAQLEDPANLARLSDSRSRALIEVLIRTGLRVSDACRLGTGCLVRDPQGAPYLHYRNHKMRREAMIPIDEALAEVITAQQARVRSDYPTGTVLFPRGTSNPDGKLPMPAATFTSHLKQWLADCDITDSLGRPAHVTAHQFRHTYASRLINKEVSQEVVRRLLDHTSHTMTARYARLADATIRQHWERAQKIDIHGEPAELPQDDRLADAAWMKQSLARAKMSLPNGYCGLPVQKSCPHANACLTCPLFITTAEFLPEHQRQLESTRTLITQAEQSGQARVVEMNRKVEQNLLTIIDTLHPEGTPDRGCSCGADSCGCADPHEGPGDAG